MTRQITSHVIESTICEYRSGKASRLCRIAIKLCGVKDLARGVNIRRIAIKFCGVRGLARGVNIRTSAEKSDGHRMEGVASDDTFFCVLPYNAKTPTNTIKIPVDCALF